MKKIIIFLVIFSTNATTISQTDDLNTKKYWKFRNAFRQNYVKIGPERGESLPTGRRNPGACVDNVTFGADGKPEGWMSWGDGMIRHGHYIGFLALNIKP